MTLIYILFYATSGVFLGISVLLVRHQFYELAGNSAILLNVVLSDLDEDTKFEELKRMVRVELTSLAKFLAMSGGLVAVSLLPLWIANQWILPAYSEKLWKLLALGLGSILPFTFRKKGKGDYSELSRLFHKLVLPNYATHKALFRLEKKLYKNHVKVDIDREEFVVVSGLARAGTTALTNALYKTGSFQSLKYSNMPFLLAPRLWGKIHKPRGEKKERKHNDGVLVGKDSIEMLDEYFFKVMLRDSYIGEDSISEHELSESIYRRYIEYQSLVCKKGRTYLTKNNNLILRYTSLRTFNQQFHAVFLFREPLDHARSLMRQQENFTNKQETDSFVLEYMNWLGHHEFGNGLKPFNFGEELPVNSDSIDFWLKSWINFYRKLLGVLDDRIVLIEYSDFLHFPNETIGMVLHKLNIGVNSTQLQSFRPKSINEMDITFTKMILDEAIRIYRQLQSKKLQILFDAT